MMGNLIQNVLLLFIIVLVKEETRATLLPSKNHDQLRTIAGLEFLNDERFALDPYIFNVNQLLFESAFYKGQLNVSGGVFSGLGTYKVIDYEFINEDMAARATLHFPKLKLEAERYEMKGSILDAIPIAGLGKLSIEVENLTFHTKAYFKQSDNGKYFLLHKLQDTSFEVSKILSQTQFDGNFDDILNTMIEDLLATYLTKFNQYFVNQYSHYIVSIHNFLAEMYDAASFKNIENALSFLFSYKLMSNL